MSSNLPSSPISSDSQLGLNVHEALQAKNKIDPFQAQIDELIQDSFATEGDALAAVTEFEKVNATFYVKKVSGETVSFQGAEVKREKAGTYNKKNLNAVDYKYLRPLALVGFADTARLRFLHSTNQTTITEKLTEDEMKDKVAAGAKRDLTVRRTVVKNTDSSRLVQAKSVYRTMLKLQEMGLVEQVFFENGPVWQITDAGLKKVGDPLNLKKAQRIDARTIDPHKVASHMATVHLMFGILSPDPFMRKALGFKHTGAPDLSEIITEKQVLKWWGEWDARMNQDYRENKDMKPGFGSWRKARMTELVSDLKIRGDLEWSELLAAEPAMWVQGHGGLSLSQAGASDVAHRRFVDLIWNRESKRSEQRHMSIGFEVETTVESASTYKRWLYTFEQEFKLVGGPYAAMIVVVPDSVAGRSIMTSFKKAEVDRVTEKAQAAGEAPKDRKLTQDEVKAALAKYGILEKSVLLATMVFPDGSGYDPRAPRH